MAAVRSGECGKPIFADTNDPDYQALLATFQPLLTQLAKTPRMDMAGGEPAADVCRDCQ